MAEDRRRRREEEEEPQSSYVPSSYQVPAPPVSLGMPPIPSFGELAAAKQRRQRQKTIHSIETVPHANLGIRDGSRGSSSLGSAGALGSSLGSSWGRGGSGGGFGGSNFGEATAAAVSFSPPPSSSCSGERFADLSLVDSEEEDSAPSDDRAGKADDDGDVVMTNGDGPTSPVAEEEASMHSSPSAKSDIYDVELIVPMGCSDFTLRTCNRNKNGAASASGVDVDGDGGRGFGFGSPPSSVEDYWYVPTTQERTSSPSSPGGGGGGGGMGHGGRRGIFGGRVDRKYRHRRGNDDPIGGGGASEAAMRYGGVGGNGSFSDGNLATMATTSERSSRSEASLGRGATAALWADSHDDREVGGCYDGGTYDPKLFGHGGRSRNLVEEERKRRAFNGDGGGGGAVRGTVGSDAGRGRGIVFDSLAGAPHPSVVVDGSGGGSVFVDADDADSVSLLGDDGGLLGGGGASSSTSLGKRGNDDRDSDMFGDQDGCFVALASDHKGRSSANDLSRASAHSSGNEMSAGCSSTDTVPLGNVTQSPQRQTGAVQGREGRRDGRPRGSDDYGDSDGDGDDEGASADDYGESKRLHGDEISGLSCDHDPIDRLPRRDDGKSGVFRQHEFGGLSPVPMKPVMSDLTPPPCSRSPFGSADGAASSSLSSMTAASMIPQCPPLNHRCAPCRGSVVASDWAVGEQRTMSTVKEEEPGTVHAQSLVLALAFLAIWSPQNLMAPNLTQMADYFHFGPSQRDLFLGANIAFATGVLSLPVSAVIGFYADVCPSRKFLYALTVVVGGVSSVCTGLSRTYGALYAARFVNGGCMSGSVPIAFSLLGDLFDTEDRNAASSGLTAMMGAGIILGQVYAGYVGDERGWQYPFYVSGVAAIASALLVLWFVDEPVRGGKEKVLQDMLARGTRYDRKLTLSGFVHAMTQNRSNFILMWQGFFCSVPWGIIFVFLNDYLSQERQMSVPDATFLVFTFGIGCAAGGVLGGYLGQETQRIDRRYLPLFMSVTTFLGIFPFIGLLDGPVGEPRWLSCLYALSGGCVANLPSVNVRPCLINVNPPETRGATLTAANLIINFARGAGPSFITMMTAMFGVNRQFSFNLTIVVFWVISAIQLCFLADSLPKDQDKMEAELAQYAASAISKGKAAGGTIASDGSAVGVPGHLDDDTASIVSIEDRITSFDARAATESLAFLGEAVREIRVEWQYRRPHFGAATGAGAAAAGVVDGGHEEEESPLLNGRRRTKSASSSSGPTRGMNGTTTFDMFVDGRLPEHVVGQVHDGDGAGGADVVSAGGGGARGGDRETARIDMHRGRKYDTYGTAGMATTL